MDKLARDHNSNQLARNQKLEEVICRLTCMFPISNAKRTKPSVATTMAKVISPT